jgi:hypothetical protein
LGLQLAQPKRVHLGRNGLAHFRVFSRFLVRFLSNFAFFDAKTKGKPHDVTIEHIKHSRQRVFGAWKAYCRISAVLIEWY